MTTLDKKVPASFWIISVLALLWNLIGVMAFVSEVMMTPEQIAALPDGQRALYTDRPIWSMVFFAVGVGTGVLGSVLLLVRRRLAVPVFIVSFLAIITYDGYWLFVRDGLAVTPMGGLVLIGAVISIALALIIFAMAATRRGWLR
ncbi:MAG: hypothetical protein AAFR20_11610 [Pseudomonadota bacterium]